MLLIFFQFFALLEHYGVIFYKAKKIFLNSFRKMKIADFTWKPSISHEFTVETDLIHRRHLSVPDSHRIFH